MEFEQLQPREVLGYFRQISAIPHGSGNTRAISDFFAEFARAHNIRYRQDAHDNVIFFLPATPGKEDHPTVILQGHMDMVCEKAADCDLDMATQGLRLRWNDTTLWAEGTSLGGDDGVAPAMFLALAADTSVAHPPLELVITADEETGMYGAAGLDCSDLRGRRLINIDSEEEGVFTVGCAGGRRCGITLPVSRKAVYGPCVKLTVEGLKGGHSGMEIHKKRANAHKIMGLFLGKVQELMPLCITAMTGGAMDNAIPNCCTVSLVAMGIGIDRINGVAEQVQALVRRDYNEPDAIVRADDIDALGGNALSTADSAKIIALLNAAPDGLQKWCEDIPDLVQTSLNMGSLSLDDDFEIVYSVRSSVKEEKEELARKLRELAEFYGAAYSETGDYPGWAYRKDSPLRDLMTDEYKNEYGVSPAVVTVHAGLECGLLAEKLPGLDGVSIGPNLHDIHSCRETMDLASLGRVWAYLKAVLQRL